MVEETDAGKSRAREQDGESFGELRSHLVPLSSAHSLGVELVVQARATSAEALPRELSSLGARRPKLENEMNQSRS